MKQFLLNSLKGVFFPDSDLYKYVVPEQITENDEQSFLNNPDANVGPVKVINNEEKSDDYTKLIIQLNPSWRVIECKDSIQWILQSRKGTYKDKPAWRGKSYCRTRKGLLRAIEEKVGKQMSHESQRQLDQLPDWIKS